MAAIKLTEINPLPSQPPDNLRNDANETTNYPNADIASLVSLLCSTNTFAASSIEVGLLTCNVVPGSRVNLLIRSTADVECVYENNGVTEEYHGETGIALGLGLSIRSNEKIIFTVIATANDIAPSAKALGGKYVGGQVSAAAGLGIGAKALIGGGARK